MALQRKLTELERQELRMRMKLDQRKIDQERDEFIVLVVNSTPANLAQILFDMHQRIRCLEKTIESKMSSSHEMIY